MNEPAPTPSSQLPVPDNSPKRIVIDARSRGSTGRYAERVIHHLQDIDNANDYFVIVKSEQDIKLANPRWQLVINDAKDYTFSEQLSLWWTIRRLKPDTTHFTMPQQPVLPLPGKRVTTIHDLTMMRWHNVNAINPWVYWFKEIVFRSLLWWVAHRSAAVIAPTRWVKTDIVKTFRVDPIRAHVTYEAAEPIPGKAEPIESLEPKKYILFNGNVFPHKNVERLIEAYRSIRLKHKDIKLVIAGNQGKPGAKLKEKTEEAGYDGIEWPGYVPDKQMKWLWANAAVYVYPSLSEGFGLPGLESMLAGTPVASSNATCLPEVYGNAVEYFDPADTVSMAEAINKIIGDSKRAKELIKLGKQQLKKYSWRTTAEQTLAVYQTVLAE
ncbi:MAG TPA: glycosyltransferase family 1 protein [Candidatus Saccharimonadales bacterium]